MGVGSLKKVKENIEGKQTIATGSSYYSQVLRDKRKEVVGSSEPSSSEEEPNKLGLWESIEPLVPQRYGQSALWSWGWKMGRWAAWQGLLSQELEVRGWGGWRIDTQISEERSLLDYQWSLWGCSVKLVLDIGKEVGGQNQALLPGGNTDRNSRHAGRSKSVFSPSCLLISLELPI